MAKNIILKMCFLCVLGTEHCSAYALPIDYQELVFTDLIEINVVNQPPVAVCTNRSVSANERCQADASVDNGSYDPDGDPITLAQQPPGPYPLGVTTGINLTATDSEGASASCTGSVTVMDNTPPTIICPVDRTAECTGPAGAPVTFSLTATDICSLAMLTCQHPSGSIFPLGTTQDTCTATDGSDNRSSCTFSVKVVDTIPPVITSVSANPDVLWPPNHQMVPVTVAVAASDSCDSTLSCQITSVSSNEPDHGLGDGDMAPDWQITGDLSVNLRAELSGEGNKRIYTINVQCADDAGNSSTDATTVTVEAVTVEVPSPPRPAPASSPVGLVILAGLLGLVGIGMRRRKG